MKLNFRDFLGWPIRERADRGTLGRVSDLVVDPTNGEILAVFADRDFRSIVLTSEIARIAAGEVWVEDAEALAAPTDVVKIRDILESGVEIFGNRVFTVSRQFLGEVVDFEFETIGWVMTKIEVARKILTIPTDKKIISTTQVVRISPREITVRDAAIRDSRRGEAVEISAPKMPNAAMKNSK